MSELNEELLNDDTDDFPEIGEAEEDALLQDDDDGDVLDLVPEEELNDTLETGQKNASDTPDTEVKRGSRQDKFATERKRITAPEPSGIILEEQKPNNSNRFVRQNNRGRGRGGKFQYQQAGRYQNFNQGRYSHQAGRNKTVLINPRFQGVVHVNNNARLAWDTQEQQFQPQRWGPGGPNNNMGPPMQPLQVMQPHPQMHAIQGTPQMQFQQPMQQFQGPPQMHRPIHMQPMHQGPPLQSMGPPGPQIAFTPPQHNFMPQPLPPGVPQSPMQPPNLPTPSSYWDGHNQVTAAPQVSNHQIMPYMQNNFEPPQPIVINTGQPPPQMQMPNYQYNNQFNNGPPMQHPQNQNFMQQNREVFLNNMHPQGPNRKDMFSPKRKVAATVFAQNKKRFLQARLGQVNQSQAKNKNFVLKIEDKRPSVVKEVTVTNVTTVKIEDDELTRDLRLKIEEQRRKREQVLKWKELRRVQEKGRGGQGSGPMRKPVLLAIKQIDEHKQFKGKGRNTGKGAINHRVITAVATTAAVKVEEPVVQLDEKHLSTFLADRKVLVKDETLMATRQVVINNISTSTGDRKIFQICKGIGEVQKLHRDKNDRHATITFKSVASAHAFFKKYQRHMLDLSMIEVSLTPESDGKD